WFGALLARYRSHQFAGGRTPAYWQTGMAAATAKLIRVATGRGESSAAARSQRWPPCRSRWQNRHRHFRVALREEITGPLLGEQDHCLVRTVSRQARAGRQQFFLDFNTASGEPAKQLPRRVFQPRLRAVFALQPKL